MILLLLGMGIALVLLKMKMIGVSVMKYLKTQQLRAKLRALAAALEPPCTIVTPLLASLPLFELVELGAYLLSAVATGNYFDETARRSHHVISARKVICPKNKHGVQGLCDYSWHHEAATAALPELFGAAKHYRTKNADGELSYKYKDIQSEYVGNLDKLKLFRKCMEAFDMLNPFLIPIWTNPMAISVVDCWGDRKSEAVDLMKHW